jgi:hypothetical protein
MIRLCVQLLLLIGAALLEPIVATNATAAAIQFRVTAPYPDTFAASPTSRTFITAIIADALSLDIAHIRDLQMAQVHMNVANAHFVAQSANNHIVKAMTGAVYIHFVMLSPEATAKAAAFEVMIKDPSSFIVNSLHMTGVVIDDGFPASVTLLDTYTPVSPSVANQTIILVATLDGPRHHTHINPVILTQTTSSSSSSWTTSQIVAVVVVCASCGLILAFLSLKLLLEGCRRKRKPSKAEQPLLDEQQRLLQQQQQQQQLYRQKTGISQVFSSFNSVPGR